MWNGLSTSRLEESLGFSFLPCPPRRRDFPLRCVGGVNVERPQAEPVGRAA